MTQQVHLAQRRSISTVLIPLYPNVVVDVYYQEINYCVKVLIN
ncbi:unnamed protein product [Schistosoma mattheei]|uniref:Uncharacterized protein n=1 Tax=Schistosoma mattheei TaxID=31246 RepID=A0A3P8H7J2_9TREM|nr:unnamed protein product [Schistosoma mattheei]